MNEININFEPYNYTAYYNSLKNIHMKPCKARKDDPIIETNHNVF